MKIDAYKIIDKVIKPRGEEDKRERKARIMSKLTKDGRATQCQ